MPASTRSSRSCAPTWWRGESPCTVELEPDLPSVFGDRVQLQQVALNLLMNACDAVELQPDETRRISLRTAVNEDSVVVSVTDHGDGLTDEQVRRAFEPFFTTRVNGMGLGPAHLPDDHGSSRRHPRRRSQRRAGHDVLLHAAGASKSGRGRRTARRREGTTASACCLRPTWQAAQPEAFCSGVLSATVRSQFLRLACPTPMT